jgi:hypothetical protein
MACPICQSESRIEAENFFANAEGTQNETCRRFGYDRKAFGLHLRFCLGIRKGPSAPERRLQDVKRRSHLGQLEAALESAQKLKKSAELSGNQVMEFEAAKQVTRILAMMSKQVPAPKEAITLGKGHRHILAGDFRITDRVLYPDDTEGKEMAQIFGAIYGGNKRMPGLTPKQIAHNDSLPKDAPCIQWRVAWRDCPFAADDEKQETEILRGLLTAEEAPAIATEITPSEANLLVDLDPNAPAN